MLMKKFAVDTLRHANINQIRFRYGRLNVYPNGFRRIASYIESGRIRLEMGGHSSGYDPRAERGHTHRMLFHREVVRESGEGLLVRKPLTNVQRRTVVHESCHAVHDYYRMSTRTPELRANPIRPAAYEGAAAVAAWMAALMWGYQRPNITYDSGSPSSIVHATEVADRMLRDRLTEVPQEFVQRINSTAHTGTASTYQFNGI